MLILLAWLASLLALLQADLFPGSPLMVLLAVAVRTFLQTGLFVLGHDAMHRTLVPGHSRLNDGIGRLSLLLYAGLPWGRCRRHHLRHHRWPGSLRDPDFRSARGGGVVRWYARFMANYLSPSQLVPLLSAWAAAALVLAGPQPERLINLMAFWILPLVLSSFQLFLFGTYLPHRSDPSAGGGHHVVRSLRYSPLLSLMACYHFGYHWEHHAFPDVPWYRLPELRRPTSLRRGRGDGLALPPSSALRFETDL
jgi:beta-carotene ketolase (CrtW type)